MRRLLRGGSVVLALVLALSVTPAGSQDAPSITRLTGDTRIETAIAISGDDWEDQTASAVILAREDDYADAIAGGPLAAARRGPLLLTPRSGLAPVVGAELERVLAPEATVYMLGGVVALADTVSDEVEALGYAVERLAGNNRYETALAIAREAAPNPGFLTIASGNTFQDALIAGSLASTFDGGALILTDGDLLPEVVGDYLEAHDGVAKTTVGPAASTAFPEPFTVQGDTPVERSVQAARDFYDREALRPDAVALASVERFPDALTGAAHAFRSGFLPMLLTPGDALPTVVAEYVAELEAAGESFVYGGPDAISDEVLDQLRDALEG